MNNDFPRHLRAAVAPAWWTIVIAVVFLLIQWGAYLLVMTSRPQWVLAFWGPDMTWATVQNIWLHMTADFKLAIWIMALLALWLTLWSRRLQRPR
jgi:hypothetical protein